MNKTTVWSLQVVAVLAAAPLFWVVFGVPAASLVWAIVLILMASLLAAAFRIGWGTRTRSIADVLGDIDTESPPIVVLATSAVSTPRRARLKGRDLR